MVVFVGFSQCFTTTSCTGGTVPASTARECCIETNEGLSFSDGGTCTVCIGNMQVCTIVPEISVCTYIGIGILFKWYTYGLHSVYKYMQMCTIVPEISVCIYIPICIYHVCVQVKAYILTYRNIIIKKQIIFFVSYMFHSVHGFASVSYNAVEGESLNTTFHHNVKGTTNLQTLSILGIISSEAGTASERLGNLICCPMYYTLTSRRQFGF